MPDAVAAKTSHNSKASGWNPVASFRKDITLKPNEKCHFIYMLGYIENPDDENKEIVENEKIRTNNTTNEITSIPNSTITDLKELLGAEIVVKNSNGEVVSNESNLATGYVVNDKYTISVLGDVSGDGVVDARDSLRILKYAVGTYELNNEYAKSADLNKDGIIDARDSLRILKYAVDTYKIEL